MGKLLLVYVWGVALSRYGDDDKLLCSFLCVPKSLAINTSHDCFRLKYIHTTLERFHEST